ncbi:uncharacterized protein RJT21DRAFT_117411 [Scheffersomyces amazonensis]|uniref:uncharacterized protein n=1 Tax=Scheffersomyces amazonensis TaxID=1078765 RepID=UPI00315DA192
MFSYNNHNRRQDRSVSPQQQISQHPISPSSDHHVDPYLPTPNNYEDEFEMSILSDSNLDSASPPRSFVNHLMTSNGGFTNDYTQRYRSRSTPQKLFTIPKKVFKWIYSISSVIFALLTLAFVAVTPIDVIVQTSGTTFSGVKMFIVIIVCVVFLFLSIVLYLSRIFQYNSHLNEIPTYSVYIPDEHDLPKPVFLEIDESIRNCVGNIKLKAGPLFNKSVTINHPGISPPHYIQECYKQGEPGTLFPPETIYEDIIRSLGDKFLFDSKAFTQTELPFDLTLREMIIYLGHVYNIRGSEFNPNEPNLKLLISLYEKFRFGPELINETDLFHFIIEFDKLGQTWSGTYQSKMGAPSSNFHKRRKSSNKSVELSDAQTAYLQPQDNAFRRSSSALIFDYEDNDSYFDKYSTTRGDIEGFNETGDDEYQFYHQKAGSEFFSKVPEDEGEDDSGKANVDSSLESLNRRTRKCEPSNSQQSQLDSISTNSSKSYMKNNHLTMTPITPLGRNSQRKGSDNASISSSRSVIRNKLAINPTRRQSNVRYPEDADSFNSSESVIIRNKSESNTPSHSQSYLNLRYEDAAISVRRNSGYMSDSEQEKEEKEEREDIEVDNEDDIYNFRTRNKSSDS